MTLTAIIPLSYDGSSIQDFDGGIWLEIAVGLAETPSVRGVDTTIPALAGTLPGNRVNHTLAIELRGHVRAGSSISGTVPERADHYTNLRAVRQIFRPDRDRALLAATLPDGTIIGIQARPLNIIANEIVAGEYTELSISLEGDDDWAEVTGS